VPTFRTYYFVVAFVLANVCNSQNRSFSFQHYGPEDGLSNTNVFAINQNKNNIMYFATENGIYHFDGYTFNKIKPKNSFKFSDIRNIDFTEDNNLLIINRRSGIFEYDSKKQSALPYSNIKFNNSVDVFLSDSNYYYSLTEQISVSAINKATGQFIDDEIKLKYKALKKDNQAFAIHKTTTNTILIGRTDGLYEFKNGKQEKINLSKKITVYAITEDENGTVYLGSDDAIYCLKNNTIVKTIPVKPKRVKSFFELNNSAKISKLIIDKYDRIWFTINPEDNLYLLENNTIYDAFELLGIDKVLINAIYKDVDDHIWVGTFNDGVFFIQNPTLKNISYTAGRKTLPVTTAKFINNNVVVGTLNGLFITDKNNLNTQIVTPSDELFGEIIYSIQQNNNQVVFSKNNSATNTKKSFLLENKNYSFIPIAARLFEFTEKKDEALLADGLGTLYRIKNYTQEKYTITDTLVSFPDYRTKINTTYNTKNVLYIGTSDGLTLYNKTSKKHHNPSQQNYNYSINHISNFNGKTYLAHDNGITIFEDSTLIQQIGEQRLTAVKKIKFYQNKIWIATLDGLYICDEQFNPIVIYNKSNGLLSNTINDIVFDGGNCCICSNKGITICTIDDLIKKVRIADKLFINSVEIDENIIDFKNNTIKLKSFENDLNINFSSPLYAKPNKQYFRYKFDKNKWQNLENTQVHLTALEGGNHTVQIICSYDGVNWSNPTIITITKDIPFKQTIWFVISIVTAFLIFTLFISYLIIKRVKINASKKVQDDRQVNLLKHQAMNSLMSPHFIFNSLTSIQNYINANDSLKASEYLAKFSRLIRMIIEKASQGDITLHEELTRLNYYLDLEKERFKGKFDFIINVEDNLNTFDIKIPNMIIQPYAENSIIHGILPKHEHGTLKISFKKTAQNTLLILIEDDGIGYNKAKHNAKAGHKSLGTKTIENILELNTKLTGKTQSVKIEDKSDLDPKLHGTIISITIQLN